VNSPSDASATASASAAAAVVRLGPEVVTPGLFTALHTGAVVARADAAVLAVSGPGAVLCVQGLLTNDIEKPGDEAFVYGALLTPKGMIVVDGWAARQGATVTYTVPADVRDRALAIFTRALPPRLARVRDQSAEVAVLRVTGAHALAISHAAGIPVAPVGRVAHPVPSEPAWEVARANEQASFAAQIVAPLADADRVSERLVAAGALAAGNVALECARILAGWPRVGAEVDDKTIPQEVRLDELGGVSYTKGCYTGQETVSRLHFRGHVNRFLRGLLFDGEPAAASPAVVHLDREVGRLTSIMWAPEPRIAGAGRWIGLAMVRFEVKAGAVVRAGGRDARLVELPFAVPFTAPA